MRGRMSQRNLVNNLGEANEFAGERMRRESMANISRRGARRCKYRVVMDPSRRSSSRFLSPDFSYCVPGSSRSARYLSSLSLPFSPSLSRHLPPTEP